MAQTDFWKDRRITVLGGTGFLGRRLMARLLDLGAQARAASRSTGFDLRKAEDALRCFTEFKPEIAFNCAGHQGGNAYQLLHPAELFLDNILMGTHSMEAARMAGVRKYVNLVPACAYPGYVADGALLEENLDRGPLHESVDHYGITKRAAYSQAKAYRKQFGFVAISLSLFNLYGPGDHFAPDQSHGLAALIRRFHEARRDGVPEVSVWGTGRAVRDWIYVDDGIEGLLKAAEVYSDVSLLNICSNRACPMADIAETVKKVLGYRGKILYDASKPEGALFKKGDGAKMRKMLDWEPCTSLEDGIARTAEWFERNYEQAIKS